MKACIEGGADHVDISGEPQYLETMQLKYAKEAEEKGVHIVGACGFDSVPADMGTLFLQDSFEGREWFCWMHCEGTSLPALPFF